jgi:hypothetical protein
LEGVQVKATVQIFLCYARLDRRKVEDIYQKLSDAGFKPWMDKKDLLPGERWKSSIQKAVRRSDFFLACLSANSVNKRGFLQKEINDALDIWREKLDSDIYLIPARLEDCEMPESLRDFQWVDLFEEDGWTRLVKAIQVGMERRGEAIKPVVQESTLFDPYPAHEEPSPGMETVTSKGGHERLRKEHRNMILDPATVNKAYRVLFQALGYLIEAAGRWLNRPQSEPPQSATSGKSPVSEEPPISLGETSSESLGLSLTEEDLADILSKRSEYEVRRILEEIESLLIKRLPTLEKNIRRFQQELDQEHPETKFLYEDKVAEYKQRRDEAEQRLAELLDTVSDGCVHPVRRYLE